MKNLIFGKLLIDFFFFILAHFIHYLLHSDKFLLQHKYIVGTRSLYLVLNNMCDDALTYFIFVNFSILKHVNVNLSFMDVSKNLKRVREIRLYTTGMIYQFQKSV